MFYCYMKRYNRNELKGIVQKHRDYKFAIKEFGSPLFFVLILLVSSFKVLTFITLQFGLVSLGWAFDLCKSIFFLELNWTGLVDQVWTGMKPASDSLEKTFYSMLKMMKQEIETLTLEIIAKSLLNEYRNRTCSHRDPYMN